jgi:hypothetical protein
MKLGTIIELPDGRVGTVVYNSLIGVGIKWGEHYPDPSDFEGTSGNLLNATVPENWPWEPDALLRQPWDGCKKYGFTEDECVGDSFEIITKQTGESDE